MIEFKLPALGSEVESGKLLEWRIKAGDKVKRGDVVAVVDTTKAAVEVEIWEEGTVHELVVKPGDIVPVGTVLALLLAPGEAPIEIVRRKISPAARKHAADLGMVIATLPGTGPGGAVTLEDVDRAARPKEKAEKVPDRALEMRKAIAAAMSRSKREIPHYYLWETVPMQRAVDWLARANEGRAVTERLLMAVLLLKATALACKAYPDMNGYYRDGAFQPAPAVHMGVAISLRQGGLVAPAIHDADKLPLPDLMKSLADLVKRARAGSLRSSEMSDPTITVTNLGEGGVEATFPVIYPPQVAIVGFGRVALRPWVEGDSVRAAPTVVASLAADHRASDGHRGARFLDELGRLLQQPEKL